MSESTLQREIEALRPATEGTLQQVAKGVPLMGRDPDGKAKMINVDENGKVQAEDTTAHSKLDSINSKDFATSAKQDSIKAVLDALNAKDISTSAKQEAIRLLVDTLSKKDFATNAELQAIKAELATIKTNQLSGDQKVQLNGNLGELFGESLSDRPAANSVSVGTTFMVVGDTVVYQSNGTEWVVISE